MIHTFQVNQKTDFYQKVFVPHGELLYLIIINIYLLYLMEITNMSQSRSDVACLALTKTLITNERVCRLPCKALQPGKI